MKVYFNTKPLENNDRFRGVGYYTKNLLTQFKKIEKKGGMKLVDSVDEADIVHYPFFSPFFLSLPQKFNKPTLITVHDLIQLRLPKHFPPGIRGKINWWRQKRRLSNLAGIITVSRHSRRDIIELANYPKEKIHFAHLAANEKFQLMTDKKRLRRIRVKYSLPEKFILYVGDINYNKNVPSLVRACQQLKIPLVIVGKSAVAVDYDRDHIENQDLVWLQKKYNVSSIKYRGKEKKLFLLGFVSTEDLAALYNLATIYCQPSFYEGFGLPLLEAMACGCPILSSNQASLPEIGGKGVLYFNPYQKNDLKKSVNSLYSNEAKRKRIAKEGLKRVKEFSWSKTAAKTLKIYEKTLN